MSLGRQSILWEIPIIWVTGIYIAWIVTYQWAARVLWDSCISLGRQYILWENTYYMGWQVYTIR